MTISKLVIVPPCRMGVGGMVECKVLNDELLMLQEQVLVLIKGWCETSALGAHWVSAL